MRRHHTLPARLGGLKRDVDECAGLSPRWRDADGEKRDSELSGSQGGGADDGEGESKYDSWPSRKRQQKPLRRASSLHEASSRLSVWDLNSMLQTGTGSAPLPQSQPPATAPEQELIHEQGGQAELEQETSDGDDLEIDDLEIEAVLSSLAASGEAAESAEGEGGEARSPSFLPSPPPPTHATDVSFNVSELLAVLEPSALAWAAVDAQERLTASPQAAGEAAQPLTEAGPAGDEAEPAELCAAVPHSARWLEERSTSLNALERKEWTAEEDETIRRGVEQFGKQWRRIAANLSGRSDDAVRNRWSRLKASADSGRSTRAAEEEDETGATGDGSPPVARKRPSFEGGEKRTERMSWTHAEDSVISACVAEFGHKWYRIEQRLPGRTSHAIRNRWQRLLTMNDERSRRGVARTPSTAGRGRAPSEPWPALPPPAEEEEEDGRSRAATLLGEMEWVPPEMYAEAYVSGPAPGEMVWEQV